jgi:uncharacterized protein (TIRG00374 family)
VRSVISLAALGAAAWAISGKTDELQGATSFLSNVRWFWLALAVWAEVVSYLAMSSLQRRLLWAGRVRIHVAPMLGITLAGAAIQNSLPGGTVFSYAYDYRQYRRYGADDVLAGWTLVAFNGVAFVCLALLALVGLGMALAGGDTYNLVESVLIVVAIAASIILAWTMRARLLPHITRLVRLSQRYVHRPDPKVSAEAYVSGLIGQIAAVTPSRAVWARSLVMGMANWLGDLSCLALSFMAVGTGIPWRGLLLAYGAGQLAVALPVTPGGLGVVEGSLTVALVAFGGGETSTVAAVLLYRIISFWGLLPVGWGSWLAVALVNRNRVAVEPVNAA